MTAWQRSTAFGVVLGVVLGAQAALLAVLLHRPDLPHHSLWLLTFSAPLFSVSVALLARSGLPPRTGLLTVLGAAAAFQLIALTQHPLTSGDVYRYIWDGRVQLAGTDPYRYAPQDPQLEPLRRPPLFGRDQHCGFVIPGGCTRINRPAVHTIYPPVAQAAFVAVRLASLGGRGGDLPFRVAGALGALAITWVLARRLLATGAPVWRAALWGWCPITVSEFGNNAHIDWLAVLLGVLALTSAATGRNGRAGLLIGAAIATKIYPLLVLPALLRGRARVTAVAAAALVAASYLPHLAAAGGHVLGYLPGYLHEEGYGNGSRLLLLGAVLPRPVDVLAGAVILAVVGYRAWRQADPAAPEHAATVTVGAAFLVATPNYGWYAALLLALAVLSGRWEWLPVAFAPSFTYLYRGEYLHSGIPSAAIYLLAALAAAACYGIRRTWPGAPERPRLLDAGARDRADEEPLAGHEQQQHR